MELLGCAALRTCRRRGPSEATLSARERRRLENGAAIDAHDTVFRFNQPVEGFEAAVGGADVSAGLGSIAARHASDARQAAENLRLRSAGDNREIAAPGDQSVSHHLPHSYHGASGPTRGTRSAHSILSAAHTDCVPDTGDHRQSIYIGSLCGGVP